MLWGVSNITFSVAVTFRDVSRQKKESIPATSHQATPVHIQERKFTDEVLPEASAALRSEESRQEVGERKDRATDGASGRSVGRRE